VAQKSFCVISKSTARASRTTPRAKSVLTIDISMARMTVIASDDLSPVSPTPFLERQLVVSALLYGIRLVFAANSQGLLTKEEASSTFVDPTFLSLRLQHHVFATNFYTYVLFLWTGDLAPFLFFGRFVKAAIMASLPALTYLYLKRGFPFSGPRAFAAAVAIGLLPGVICFSWLGVEFGLETPLGFLALWLALFEFPVCIVASFVAAALAGGCYGSGLAFLPAVLVYQLPRLRKTKLRWAVFAGSAMAGLVLAFPVFWWTNIQSLWTGGGGHPVAAGAPGRLARLFLELFIRGRSYYFFGNSAAALSGIVVGLAALAGIAVTGFRKASKTWPLLVLSIGVLGMYAVAGNVSGVRRAIPLVVSLAIFATLLLDMLSSQRPRWRTIAFYGPILILIAVEGIQYNGIRNGLATSKLELPHDFEFQIPPGKNMAEEIALLSGGFQKLPSDLAGYEPDRTLCILYRLTQPNPIVGVHEIVARCDQHGWSIPSNSPRFSQLKGRQ
jgi:hypothetical protein